MEVLPNRRCSTCTDKMKTEYGCNGNAKQPIILDGEKLTTCPLRPYKDNPSLFVELSTLFFFMDKGILAEAGSFYDQPAYYVDVMLEMQSVNNDKYAVKEDFDKRRSKALDTEMNTLRDLGLPISPKK